MSENAQRCLSCSVTNCQYHENPNRCTADTVEISNSNATKSRETLCSTFKPDSHCSNCK